MRSKGFDALKGLEVRHFDEENETAKLEAKMQAERERKANARAFNEELERLGMRQKTTQGEDADLFAREMAKMGVVALKDAKKPHPGATKKLGKVMTPATRARVEMQLSDNFDATSEDEWADRDYVAVGSSIDLVQKLKRNLWPIGAHLDLHGYTIEEARSALTTFIVAARDEHIRCVRVVHGKGMNSEEGPVLKTMVRRWLRQMPEVQAFIQALPGEGGSGAVRVLLAKKL